MKSINKYEEEGRMKFVMKMHLSDYVLSNITDVYDVAFEQNNILYLVEIKQRKDSTYGFGDMFLEKAKYDSLMNLKNKIEDQSTKKVKVLYVHTYENLDKIRIRELNPGLSGFKRQSHQNSQVYYSHHKIKHIKYLTEYKEF